MALAQSSQGFIRPDPSNCVGIPGGRRVADLARGTGVTFDWPQLIPNEVT